MPKTEFSVAKLYEISKSDDPKSAIFAAIGDLSKITHIFSGRLLVGLYIAPEKTKGGIILTDKSKTEDRYQAQVGLILKKGERAFKDDENTKFYGQDVKIGDWVIFRPGDGKRVQINGVDCRWIEDTLIDAVIERPDIVTYRNS